MKTNTMSKTNFPFKPFYIFMLLLLAFSLQFCKTSQKAVTKASIPTVTYTKDISPIMSRSCAPCHFPETGKLKWLNTYEATRDNVNEILHRVQLPADDEAFMPFKHKKPALSVGEIQLLKAWMAQRMPK